MKICSSKTNQFMKYLSEIPSFANANSLLCPISWMDDILALCNPKVDELLFKICKNGKWVPMPNVLFNKRLKEFQRKSCL